MQRSVSLNAINVVIEPFHLLSTDIAINLLSTFRKEETDFCPPNSVCNRVFILIRVMKSTMNAHSSVYLIRNLSRSKESIE